jgi:hypothetical protein
MDADIWLPLATLVLGWAGAQVTEALRDRRTTTRERLARRAELQRTTLLELQDALRELDRHVSTALAGRFYGARNPTSEKAREMAAEAERHMYEAENGVVLLVSRLLDAKARDLVHLFLASTHDALASVETKARQTIISDLSHTYTHAIERLGELLRERY